MNHAITIPMSRTKTIVCLLLAWCFVIVSLVLLIYADKMFPTNPIRIKFVQGSGVLGIIIFSFFGLVIIKRLFGQSWRLIIDQSGMTIANFGLVEWQDIAGIDTITIHSNKLLLIYLKNEQKYLRKLSKYQLFIAKINMKYYGSPLLISSIAYQCSFEQLAQLLSQGLVDYQQSTS